MTSVLVHIRNGYCYFIANKIISFQLVSYNGRGLNKQKQNLASNSFFGHYAFFSHYAKKS